MESTHTRLLDASQACGDSYGAPHFGEHLTIDGYDGDTQRLDSEALVRRTLDELPTLLGMRKLAPPTVHFAKGNDLKDPGGWSGMVVIEESHISVHTFPAAGFVSIDVYTCRNGLSIDHVIDYFREVFGLGAVETNFIRRGQRFEELAARRMERGGRAGRTQPAGRS